MKGPRQQRRRVKRRECKWKDGKNRKELEEIRGDALDEHADLRKEWKERPSASRSK